MNQFKRTTTNFEGGEARINGRTRELGSQPVRIIRPAVGGNDDEEDLFEVEFFNLGRGIVDAADLHPHPNAKATNAEFMAWLVEDASPNPLMQGFVPEAVAKYAELCLSKPEQFEDKPGEVSFLNGKAWLGIAQEALDAINANYRN